MSRWTGGEWRMRMGRETPISCDDDLGKLDLLIKASSFGGMKLWMLLEL